MLFRFERVKVSGYAWLQSRKERHGVEGVSLFYRIAMASLDKVSQAGLCTNAESSTIANVALAISTPRSKELLPSVKPRASISHGSDLITEVHSTRGFSLLAKCKTAPMDNRLVAKFSCNGDVNALARDLPERIPASTFDVTESSSQNETCGLEDAKTSVKLDELSLSTIDGLDSSKHPRQAVTEPSKTGLIVVRDESEDGEEGKERSTEDLAVSNGYPVPLSPHMGEAARLIELDRAMSADAAMKAGPAVPREAIIYEDEWMIVINKPCGVYSEHVMASVPCLLNKSHAYVPPFDGPVNTEQSAKSELPHLHMANRLDRDTSGVMVLTKCKLAAKKLTQAFTAHKVRKTYIALCVGAQPRWKSVIVESGHGRSRYGAWRVYAKKDVGRVLPGGSLIKNMTTRLSILTSEQHKNAEMGSCEVREDIRRDSFKDKLIIAGEENGGLLGEDDASAELSEVDEETWKLPEAGTEVSEVIVKAFPLTGRTHQIRLHCQYLGLSLLGDVKYGGLHEWKRKRYPNHFLHAESMHLKHPMTSKDLIFVAPCPQWAL